ncbi:MAG: hypothetical protein ACPGEG_01495 [Salibacteraceae bacterium]
MRVKIAVFVISILAFPLWSKAQCSMCRLMAESSYESGSQIGQGLNDGIFYIMGIPYILIAGIGFILYKKNFSK